MKFAITRTTGELSDAEAESEGCTRETITWRNAIDHPVAEDVWLKEFATVESLLDFADRLGGDLVLKAPWVNSHGFPEVEIYDTWRE